MATEPNTATTPQPTMTENNTRHGEIGRVPPFAAAFRRRQTFHAYEAQNVASPIKTLIRTKFSVRGSSQGVAYIARIAA
jgi:hypothetical protein